MKGMALTATVLFVLVGLVSAQDQTAAQKNADEGTYYVSGDIEGTSGYKGHTDKDNAILREHFLATVEGFRDGGAKKVILKSFHGIPGDYPEYVEKSFQDLPTDGDLPGLTPGMSGLALVGFHGLPPESGFGHAYRFSFFFLNDRKVGEVTIQVLLAASRGVPTVLYVGDEWGAKEVHALAPDAVIVNTRPGKRPDEGDLDPAVIAKIRQGAKEAALKQGKVAVPKMPEKMVLTIPMRSDRAAKLAPTMLKYPVTVDGRRVSRESTNFADIYQFLLDMFKVHDEAIRQEQQQYGR